MDHHCQGVDLLYIGNNVVNVAVSSHASDGMTCPPGFQPEVTTTTHQVQQVSVQQVRGSPPDEISNLSGFYCRNLLTRPGMGQINAD